MIVLIADAFFTDFELVKTENLDITKERIKDMISGKDVTINDEYYGIIGTMDDMTTKEALDLADETLYIQDFEE